MTTQKSILQLLDLSGQKRKTIITPKYILASFLGAQDFEKFVKSYPPSNPENLSKLDGIEEALFHSYPDDMMFMNEGVFMILISHGFKFNNDLFALLVLGSIYEIIGKNGIAENPELKACFEYYQQLDVKIEGEKELITQSQSFVHYMYDTESHNQEAYQSALERIPIIISSFRTGNGKQLFPNFKYEIVV
jgi:hypothetical protein